MRRVTLAASLFALLAVGCTTPPVVPGEGLRTADFGLRKRLYPTYTADPRRAVFGLEGTTVLQDNIQGVSDGRTNVRLGGRVGLFRHGRPDSDRDAIQVELELAYIGGFDGSENFGWDEFYGLFVVWHALPEFIGQVGIRRDSGKLSDSYADDNLRADLDYVRDELVFAGTVELDPRLRVYGEYAYGFQLENERVMEEGRIQGGAEFEGRPALFHGRWSPYAALDLSAWQEDDWDPNFALQAGLVTRPGSLTLRVGLEFVDGRPALGEFFREDEQWVSAGVWVEL